MTKLSTPQHTKVLFETAQALTDSAARLRVIALDNKRTPQAIMMEAANELRSVWGGIRWDLIVKYGTEK